MREISAPLTTQIHVGTPRLTPKLDRRITVSPQLSITQPSWQPYPQQHTISPAPSPRCQQQLLHATTGHPIVATPSRIIQVVPSSEGVKGTDEQLWWANRVQKLTTSIDQKLSSVVGADKSPPLRSTVLDVEVHVEPTRSGPPAGETVRAAAFDYQEGGRDFSSRSPAQCISDSEIPSGLAALKTMRQEIEVLRERQQNETPCQLSFPEPTFRSNRTPTPPSPGRQRVDTMDSSVTGVTQMQEPPEHQMDVALEHHPDLSSRQEQQELRIQALQAKVRHLEEQVSGELPRHGFSTTPQSPKNLERQLETEIGTLKQELKAQHMEQALGMVQEANVLRKDVSLALRNERETRSGEVSELRSSLETMHDRLMREFHETMDLVGARFEHHLQEAINPDRLQELVSQKLEMSRIVQKASVIQQGKSSAGDTTDIDIEREARCRSIIDLRMELEGSLSDAVEKLEQQCASLAQEMSTIQDHVGAMLSNPRVGDREVSFGDHNAMSDLQALAEQLESEKSIRTSEVQHLTQCVEGLLVNSGLGNSERESLDASALEELSTLKTKVLSIESTQVVWHSSLQEAKDMKYEATERMMKSFARELDQERENRSAIIQDMHVRFGQELAEIRERDKAQSKALEVSIKCEREARLSEISEMRAILDSWRREPITSVRSPGGASRHDPT